nr:MAG TPA: hypothetical protein [Caudoviricetes sp.]
MVDLADLNVEVEASAEGINAPLQVVELLAVVTISDGLHREVLLSDFVTRDADRVDDSVVGTAPGGFIPAGFDGANRVFPPYEIDATANRIDQNAGVGNATGCKLEIPTQENQTVQVARRVAKISHTLRGVVFVLEIVFVLERSEALRFEHFNQYIVFHGKNLPLIFCGNDRRCQVVKRFVIVPRDFVVVERLVDFGEALVAVALRLDGGDFVNQLLEHLCVPPWCFDVCVIPHKRRVFNAQIVQRITLYLGIF